jgi:hypothetical protein
MDVIGKFGLAAEAAAACHEQAWSRIRFREPLPKSYDYDDAAFEHADPGRAEADFAAFIEECDVARRAVARVSLDDGFTRRAWPHAVARAGSTPT